MRSMTGFGRSEINTPFGRLVLEIQSVNRKYLETFIYLPKELLSFEIEIRKMVMMSLSRGQVNLRFSFLFDEKNKLGLFPNAKLLKKMKNGWVQIAHDLGFPKNEINLSFLSQRLDSVSSQNTWDLKRLKRPIQDCTKKALHELLIMKKLEGKSLKKDIEKRLIHIEKKITKIENLAPMVKKKVFEKLKTKIQVLVGNLKEDNAIRELAPLLEKLDITEEIVRFRSHNKQFFSLLKFEDKIVGKKMDFLVQEMLREANTISSKSPDSQITSFIIDIKTELERIREQIQNIE